MTDLMQKVLAAKLQARKKIAKFPFEEKLAILEKMRDRSLFLASYRLKKRRGRSEPISKPREGRHICSPGF
jgi:hypothetical protein